MLFIPRRSQSRIFSPLLVSLFILIIFKYCALFCLVWEFTSVGLRIGFDLINKTNTNDAWGRVLATQENNLK